MAIGVKICGITTTDAVEAAVAAGAQFGGLVFHPKSPRFVPLEQAALLADRMRGRLKIVALIADMDDARIEALVAAVRPDLLQLHGGESARRVADIRGRFGLPVIKALAVAQASDFDAVAEFESVADMLMFDAQPPRGAERAGGHGAAFDWTLLDGRTFGKPWFLAGGLTPDNVGRAAVLSQAALVDVSSGVESAPGVKDAAKIAAFINATKQPAQSA
ncbi:MAG TPA: phosphoribosylanthranilate isomerase [Rhizomicrobium sp.]